MFETSPPVYPDADPFSNLFGDLEAKDTSGVSAGWVQTQADERD